VSAELYGSRQQGMVVVEGGKFKRFPPPEPAGNGICSSDAARSSV